MLLVSRCQRFFRRFTRFLSYGHLEVSGIMMLGGVAQVVPVTKPSWCSKMLKVDS